MAQTDFRERLQRKRKDLQSKGGGKPYKFKAGKTRFVVLPDKNGGEDFDRAFGQMWIKRPGEKKPVAVLGCRTNTYGEPDTIRQLIWDGVNFAQENENEKLADYYKSLLARSNRLLNVLILDDDAQDPDTPVFIEISDSQLEQILGAWEFRMDDLDEDELDGWDPTDLNNLQVMVVEKTGDGMDTEYKYSASTKTHKAPKDVLEKAMDLDAYIESKFSPKEEQKALAAIAQIHEKAGVPCDISDAALVDAGSGSRKALPSGTGSKDTVADADDDEDLEDADYEDVEEAVEEEQEEAEPEPEPEPKKPARRKRPAKKEPEPEPEEEEAEDTDTDEDDGDGAEDGEPAITDDEEELDRLLAEMED